MAPRGVDVTTPSADRPGEVITMAGVYAPQYDSELLTDVMTQPGLAKGRRVAELCTGSGFVRSTRLCRVQLT
jgi:release factor glutamine methyltransferase